MRHALAFGLALTLALPATVLAQRGIGVSGERSEDLDRVALVIGNGAYPMAPLRNPPNDARDMAATLRDLGFEVIEEVDANEEGMLRAIRRFGDRIRRADVALFYYAGHGIQSQGRNYLIPVGAEISSEPEIEYEAVEAGRVIAQMDAAGSPLNIVILDACRNNPFARSWRSASRGLTQVAAPTGTLIAYATAPGSVASDGDGENGLYTQELLRFMRTPGLSVEDVFKQVRISLNQQTGGEQTPWESSSLVGDFYFAPPIETEAPAAATQPEVAAADPAPQQPVQQPQDTPADPPAETRPTALTDAEFRESLSACLDPLMNADLNQFERLYSAGSDPAARGILRDWLRNAPRQRVERGADIPGIEMLSTDGRRASKSVYAEFSWRTGFGNNRSARLPIEAVMSFNDGRWALDVCRVVGSANDLR